MRTNRCCSLSNLVFFGLLVAIEPAGSAKAAEQAAKPPVVSPQIVRLSYVEGDVRISRGKAAEKQLENMPGESTGWEKAVANLPLESGYSLVTGDGRAEIEFENAAVLYLAPSSVLVLNQISATGGVPWTDIGLLSGTATLNMQSMLPGEWFKLYTPSDSFTMRYPKKAYLRFNSYVDAIATTPLQDVEWFAPADGIAGKTVTVHNGMRIPTPQMDVTAMAEWDKWVASRVAARDAAMASTMKAAGLTAPLPGLAQMDGQGRFFACEPYGTCWEPTQGWAKQHSDGAAPQPTGATQQAASTQAVAQTNTQTDADGQLEANAQTEIDAQVDHDTQADLDVQADLGAPVVAKGNASRMAVNPGMNGLFGLMDYDIFPCGPRRGLRYMMGYDQQSQLQGFEGFDLLFDAPYLWTVCHTGSWIHQQSNGRGRYVWVAGTKRHHHQPIRWVKTGRTEGYVPIHPRDVAGKTPLNLKDGFFRVAGKKGDTVERVNFNEAKSVKLLDEAPKEFRELRLEHLEIAAAPHAEAYSAFHTGTQFKGAAPAGSMIAKGAAPSGSSNVKGTELTSSMIAARGTARVDTPIAIGSAMKEPGMPINFDRKTQSFTVARPVMQEGRPATVVQPLGNSVAYSQPGSSSGARGSYSVPQSSGSSSASAPRPSAPAPSYGGGGGYSRPSAPAPAPVPASSYSGVGGGSSGGSGTHR
jgi:hypothetical protein